MPGENRHQEFIKFLRRLDAEFPGDIPLHLIMDNYGTLRSTRRAANNCSVLAAKVWREPKLRPEQGHLARRAIGSKAHPSIIGQMIVVKYILSSSDEQTLH